MNPHQKNKIDVSKMSAEEQKIFRLYGKVPNTKDLLQNKFKNERKYFDSGDYALSKAGKAADAGVTTVGSQHPVPENIPHLASPITATAPLNIPENPLGNNGNGPSGSPGKEGTFPRRASMDKPTEGVDEPQKPADGAADDANKTEEMPKPARPMSIPSNIMGFNPATAGVGELPRPELGVNVGLSGLPKRASYGQHRRSFVSPAQENKGVPLRWQS